MKKRKLNGKFLSLVCIVIIIVISLIKIPAYTTHNKLSALGYSEEAIQSILDRGMKDLVIDNSYYSDFLNEEIVKESFDIKYLDLYLNRSSLSQDDIDLYEKIQVKKGYSEEEATKLFIALSYEDIQPLLLFDKVDDLNKYIDDIKNNSLKELKGNYLHPYENIVSIDDKESTEVVVNKKRSLGEYVPSELIKLGNTYSIPGVELEKRAYEAFYEELAPAIAKQGFAIYAVGGYVSYEDQESLYNMYDLPSEAEERNVLRPGHNEKQTGLIVTVVASENQGAQRSFKDTNSYKWLKAHAHEYGFIFRYPNGKENMTGRYDEFENQLRYVGVNLATKVNNSGLSLDEYFAYYMN